MERETERETNREIGRRIEVTTEKKKQVEKGRVKQWTE
jgi:hypothetical protein